MRVDAIGRSLTGKIVRFTRDVNFETRTMETEVDVENKDLSISPGMYANTMLRLAHVENVVTIPVEALVLNGRQQVVYVLDDDQSRPHPPRAGRHRRIEARRDQERPQAGDRVIVGGQDKYQEGEEVSPAMSQQRRPPKH